MCSVRRLGKALTHVEHFKGLLSALDFHFCGSTDIHVVVLVLTHGLGLRGPGGSERGGRKVDGRRNKAERLCLFSTSFRLC